jgi:nicotinate-nucleotide--dimethylbenzimidazole phosphoribosyltransferase
VGPGAGLDEAGIRRKSDTVGRAVSFHRAHLQDPLEVLRRLGGRELAAMAGSILAARHRRVPVLIDGYVATAAAAVLHRANPDVLSHCLVAHCSAEPGHAALLRSIGKKPLLDLGMRLGEGSAAALAAGLVKAAVALHRGMATFTAAGVSERSRG